MSVPPSTLGTQPIGAASRVAGGVFQLKLPVPFPLRFISSYLIREEDGWTVIDPGFDYPPARRVWEEAAGDLGIDLDRDLSRIIVTHLHPDHLGLAGWLEALSGAPVWMLEGEIENARRVWTSGDAAGLEGFLRRNGMNHDTARDVASLTGSEVRMPQEIFALRPGDEVSLGEGSARVIHTPGHSDYHFMLFDEGSGLLLAGDHLLLRITPNIGLWPYTAAKPLGRYLASLRSLRGLGAKTVLPGHGPLFHDLDGRIDELLAHHAERLDVMHAVFEGRPATPFEISRRVFRKDLTAHEMRFALAETLAHLEYLEDEGRAVRLAEDDVVRYAPL